LRWQSFISSSGSGVLAPYLGLKAEIPRSRDGRPIYLDARLDTGSNISAIPSTTINSCEQSGIRLWEGRGREVSAIRGDPVRTPTFWFRVTVCALPQPVSRYEPQDLEVLFRSTPSLYSTMGRPLTLEAARRGEPSDSLEMTVTDRRFAIIGFDILAEWVVLIHGPAQRFRVARGNRWRWLLCSVGPRLTALWERGT
jgi:hypothetical protein